MRIKKSQELQQNKMKELTDQLERGVIDVFESDNYKKYLLTISKFHCYSSNNCILILQQKPDATFVASYRDWKEKFHRNVRKGEKGIRILCPAPYKIMVEKEKIDPVSGRPMIGADGSVLKEKIQKIIPHYKIGMTFDISQTEGEPLPEIVKPLESDVNGYDAIMEILLDVSPVPVEWKEISGAARGYYHPGEKRIAIRADMSQLQTIKTLIHEIAHAKLHDIDDRKQVPDKTTREIEAESVAFITCKYLGLDTSEYSFGYIATYSENKELSELKKSLDKIRKGAHELIEDIKLKSNTKMIESKNYGEEEQVEISKDICPVQQKQLQTKCNTYHR